MPTTINPDAEALVSWLASRDAVCPVCGYNLRGLAEPQCPECSAPLTLSVSSPNVLVLPWGLSVVALALAIGFDLVTSAILGVGYIVDPPPAGFQIVFNPVLLGLAGLGLVCVAALCFLVGRRRAFWRLPRARQWRVGIWIFLAVGAVHTVFGLWAAHRLGLF